MKNLIITALLLFLSCFCASAEKTQTEVDTLAIYHESTALNSGKIQQEMIYLHIDNTSYYRNDRIYFACYVVTSGKLKPSEMSRTVYVELLNPNGKVIDHCVLKTVHGRCHGSLAVKETPFYSGYYEIRAYTRYMLNFGPEAVFSRIIPVFNAPKAEGDWSERDMLPYGNKKLEFQRPKPQNLKKVNVKFYPEGGRLVNGLPATVAFEITDDLRRPVKAEGRVIEHTDRKEVTTFRTGHMGRGTFSFVPRNDKYGVEFTVEGKRYNFELPKVYDTGISLSIDNLLQADSVTVTVARTPDCPTKAVGVTLTCRNELCGRYILDLTDSDLTYFNIPRSQLPTGVIQLTLFDTSGTPIADRLFFNNRNDFISFAYEFNKPHYGPLEPVEMKIRMTEADGETPRTEPFSISVTDADNQVPYGSNIMADLLLSSEVKGYIHNPAWYFLDHSDKNRQRALDCLMMIQGWRRYSWSRLAGMEEFSVDSIPEKGIEVHGQILNRWRNKPVSGATVSAMITKQLTNDSTKSQKTLFLDTYTTDQNGRFAFRSYVKGNHLLTLSTSQKGKIKPYRIILNKSEGPAVRAYDPAEMQIPDAFVDEAEPAETVTPEPEPADTVIPRGKGRRLKEVQVTAKAAPWSTGQVMETATVSYDIEESRDALLDEGKRFIRNLRDLLPHIDPNFTYHSNFLYKGRWVMFALDYGMGNNRRALLYEDFGIDDLSLLPVETIKNIYVSTKDEVIFEQICKVYRKHSLWDKLQIRRYTGAVVFIELHPELRVKMRGGMRRTTLEGYSDVIEFYSPDYSNADPFETDYRRTLYWNPDVTPDSTGTARVRFFNNSTATRFNVSTATVAPDGTIGGN